MSFKICFIYFCIHRCLYPHLILRTWGFFGMSVDVSWRLCASKMLSSLEFLMSASAFLRSSSTNSCRISPKGRSGRRASLSTFSASFLVEAVTPTWSGNLWVVVKSRDVSACCPGFWLVVHFCTANQEPACLLTQLLTMTPTHKYSSLASCSSTATEAGNAASVIQQARYVKVALVDPPSC